MKEDWKMPQVFKIGSYTVYFWMNEGKPLEPIHVHVAKGVPSQNATKIWLTKHGKCLLNSIIKIIEAQSDAVIHLWFSTFGQIRYYC